MESLNVKYYFQRLDSNIYTFKVGQKVKVLTNEQLKMFTKHKKNEK